MEKLITKYAVLIRRTNLRMHLVGVPQDVNDNDCLVAEAGTLIKVFQTQTPSTTANSKFSTVQILNFIHPNPIYENLYECPQTNLFKVSEDLWPYLISIDDPVLRLRLSQNRDQCRRTIYLKRNDLVSVTGECFGQGGLRYDCIIRYIGPVEELYPVGYFFGLELLHLDNGHSPQTENIPFADKYMQCDPTLAIFTTANWLSPIPSELKKKFSALTLLNDTIEKVRTVIGPSNCISGPGITTSLRKEKKLKKNEPTAQFYDTIIHSDAEPISSVSDPELNPSSNEDMERKHVLISNKSEKDQNQLISLDSEDFKQSIENYENNLNRQYGCNPSNTIQKIQIPSGILKNRGNIAGTTDSHITKPATVMGVQNRDIIVIDKNDIHESTKNQSNVIVVDKDKMQQQEIDLADLLGGNWPNMAGDAATILNKSQMQSSKQQLPHILAGGSGESTNTNNSASSFTNIRAGRNKSPNLLSHLDTPRHLDTQSISTSAGVNTQNVDINAVGTSQIASKLNNSVDSIEEPSTFRTATPDMDFVQNSPLPEVPDSSFGVGSMVEVCISEVAEDLHGVIRWIGVPPGAKNIMVGVELDEDQSDKQIITTNGSFNGVPLFKCPEGRALFVKPDRCAHDKRFVDMDGGFATKSYANLRRDSKMFGQVECPSVAGAIAPIKVSNLEDLEKMCGKFKGIQGHHNSCYLDATLFSMFTFTSVFDSLLFRPPESEDISHYLSVQKVLREEIVNPLRKNMFVRADRVMKLRQLLDKLSSVSGLTSEEKDPEEFLNSLLAQIMRVEPFLKLSSGQDAYFYQLFVEKDERLSFPTVQQLFEQSFFSSDIKLKEVPSCLIIQMPRFGKNYKMYPRILPSQVLDVTDIIEDSPRQCSVCGKLAEYECRDCFGILQSGVGLESTSFCQKCRETVHLHVKRANHNSKKLSVPQDFRIMADHMTVPRIYMELFAVVCIETSHYVAFVKAGSGPDAPWCFFDSMADRKGEKNGYNIPEMIAVPDLPKWLSEEGARVVNETSSNDKMLPEHAKRLFCDAYMCMYVSTDVMMYR